MVRKFFYGDDPLGKKSKKAAGAVSTEGAGRKKVFALNASAFIQKKMAEQQAKDSKKGEKK